MLSVGIDMIEIDRVAESIKKPGFIKRVFGPNELAELQARGFPAQSAAAAFAAKEAFLKALQTGLSGFSLCEIELLHKETGAPYLHLSGNAKHICEERGLQFTVSVTHTKTTAAAAVVVFAV